MSARGNPPIPRNQHKTPENAWKRPTQQHSSVKHSTQQIPSSSSQQAQPFYAISSTQQQPQQIKQQYNNNGEQSQQFRARRQEHVNKDNKRNPSNYSSSSSTAIKPTIPSESSANNNRASTNSHLLDHAKFLEKYKDQLQDASSSDEDGDEDDEEEGSVASQTFKLYDQIAGSSEQSVRTKNMIQEAQKGASRCLVCLEKIKPQAATWQCDQCYCLLHLVCIQKWVREGVVPLSLLSSDSFPNKKQPWFWYCICCL